MTWMINLFNQLLTRFKGDIEAFKLEKEIKVYEEKSEKFKEKYRNLK